MSLRDSKINYFGWWGLTNNELTECVSLPPTSLLLSKAGDFPPEGHPTGISPSFPGYLFHCKQLSGSGHQADCPALAVPSHVHNTRANEWVQDISDQFSPTAFSSARSCYKERGEEMAAGHLLLSSWMLQKTLFPPISCPDCFAEISSHLFPLCRYTPARLHFKSLLVCWFQSSPKSPIIQETDV